MKNGPRVPPALAAVLVVILIGLIGFLGYRYLIPKQTDSGMDLGSHADLSRLSPDQLDTVRKEFDAAKANRGAGSK
jgi:hypothetical protein